MEVKVVNPGKGRKGRKKMAKRKRRRKTAVAKPAPRRRRRRNPNHTAKRRSNTRRRGNPSVRGMFAPLVEALRGGGSKTAGEVWLAFIIKGLGAPGPATFPGMTPRDLAPSTFMGQSMSMATYFLAAVGIAVGARGWGMITRSKAMEDYFRGAGVDQLRRKIIWTEIIPRIPGAQNMLGAVVQDDGFGNRWYQASEGQPFQTMMGIQEATPLDAIVEAGPMMGIVEAGPMDGYTHGVASYTGAASPAADRHGYSS